MLNSVVVLKGNQILNNKPKHEFDEIKLQVTNGKLNLEYHSESGYGHHGCTVIDNEGIIFKSEIPMVKDKFEILFRGRDWKRNGSLLSFYSIRWEFNETEKHKFESWLKDNVNTF